MKITLSNYSQEEKLEVIHTALCNGLDIFNSYSIEWIITDLILYGKSRETAKKDLSSDNCLEDNMIQYLIDGGSILFRSDGLDDAFLSLAIIEANWDKISQDNLIAVHFEEDDADTADCILQSIIYEDVIIS